MKIKCKILEITDTALICENTQIMWWLGKETFKLPKDKTTERAKVGDDIVMEIT